MLRAHAITNYSLEDTNKTDQYRNSCNYIDIQLTNWNDVECICSVLRCREFWFEIIDVSEYECKCKGCGEWRGALICSHHHHTKVIRGSILVRKQDWKT